MYTRLVFSLDFCTLDSLDWCSVWSPPINQLQPLPKPVDSVPNLRLGGYYYPRNAIILPHYYTRVIIRQLFNKSWRGDFTRAWVVSPRCSLSCVELRALFVGLRAATVLVRFSSKSKWVGEPDCHSVCATQSSRSHRKLEG